MTQLKHFLLTGALCTTFLAQAQDAPFFVDGEAQIVPGFENPDEWIREDLWVETSFDTDGDGKPDTMNVYVILLIRKVIWIIFFFVRLDGLVIIVQMSHPIPFRTRT